MNDDPFMVHSRSKQGCRLAPLGVAAARIGIQPRDLRSAAESGDVSAIRVGSTLMFNVEVLERELLDRAAGKRASDSR